MNDYEDVIYQNLCNKVALGLIGKFLYLNACQKNRISEQSLFKYLPKNVGRKRRKINQANVKINK